MELKKFKQRFEENKNVLIFALLVALIAGAIGWGSGQPYGVSLALTSVRVASGQPLDYNYDNYYALRAADEFGSTILGWFKTPETVSAIFNKAGIKFSPGSFREFAGKFKAFKVSPNVVEIRFDTFSEAQAKKVSQAIGEVIAEKNKALSSSSKEGLNFTTLAGEPVILKNSWVFGQKALIGFLIGLIFGLFFQSARKYFS